MINPHNHSERFGIIHLSDLHFSADYDFITSKIESLISILRNELQGCECIFVVISGDIANKGYKAEFEIATNFLSLITDKVNELFTTCKVKCILVPGNHDCNFSNDNSLRQITVKNINYETIGSDNSVIDACTVIQDEFWSFYTLYNSLPSNKLYYKIIEEIPGISICFHCFNTAWMSQINEVPGSLFFPTKIFLDLNEFDTYNINISVYHHPSSWLNPNTPENNKNEFQNVVDSISSIQLFGHEHESDLKRSENLYHTNSYTLYEAGEIFQDHKDKLKSGFQIQIVNPKSKTIVLTRYQWQGNLYCQVSNITESLGKKQRSLLAISDNFFNKLQSINVPFSFGETKAILSDLFIYHELEQINFKHTKGINNYIDAESLLKAEQGMICALEGESQIGKSSLIYMLFFDYHKNGSYPLLLDGKDITNQESEKMIRHAFLNQYSGDSAGYDSFKQLPKEKIVLFVDNFHNCNLDRKSINDFIDFAHTRFGITFLVMDSAFSLFSHFQSSLNKIKMFSIKQFGFKKRNKLIERYLDFKSPQLNRTIEKLDKTKDVFDKLCNVLGDKLIPSYPVFILAILQMLDQSTLNTNETSHGYCYHTLIHLAFQRVGIPNDHIDAYFNFATELAFALFNDCNSSISDSEFFTFYSEYRKNFWAPGFEIMNEHFLSSHILKNENGVYEFSYKYILYFLASKKIADQVDTPEGKEIIIKLFQSLHNEKTANTLVFITHHTKNNSFIQESILSTMLPFEGISPITLKRDCHYFDLLNEICKDITNEVIEFRDPEIERMKTLDQQDRVARESTSNKNEVDDVDLDVSMYPFIHAIRAIEIVGQIIKNRKGSLNTIILKEMITELYYAGFRMIGYLGIRIQEEKTDLSRRIGEDISKNDSNIDIEKRTYTILQIISLQACLGTFSKLIHNVGVKELRDLFNEVAVEINTPAAHLVSFSINSYYGKINMKELEKLAKDFKDNPVAMEILKSRVCSYLNNNYIDYKFKQKIGSCLNVSFLPQIGNHDRGYIK